MTNTATVCGTHIGYDRGCRCQPCKNGKAERNRQLRRIQAEDIIDRLADTLHQIAQQGWRTDAACRGADPDLWFPNKGDNVNVKHALAVCHTCPVQTQCLNDNLDEQDGIFGGTTPMQRRALRKLANETRGVA